MKRLAAVAHFPLTVVLGGGAGHIMPISSEATEDQNSYLTAPEVTFTPLKVGRGQGLLVGPLIARWRGSDWPK